MAETGATPEQIAEALVPENPAGKEPEQQIEAPVRRAITITRFVSEDRFNEIQEAYQASARQFEEMRTTAFEMSVDPSAGLYNLALRLVGGA